jgi:hypothetical protein
MMRVGAEDQELGQNIGLFSCFLLAGSIAWAGSSGSFVLVGALIAVLWIVLERLIFLEVQLVKLLISNGRHVV